MSLRQSRKGVFVRRTQMHGRKRGGLDDGGGRYGGEWRVADTGGFWCFLGGDAVTDAYDGLGRTEV
jgi:hypothetical protein